jgi:hypothetical protein
MSDITFDAQHRSRDGHRILNVFASAMTIWPHLPTAIPRSDEAKCCCGGRVAKNFGVKSRINSVQAAWHHRPVAVATAVAIRPSRRRSDAENAQGGSDHKRDESLPPTHGDFLLLPEATRIESRTHCEPRKDRLVSDLLGHLKAPPPRSPPMRSLSS